VIWQWISDDEPPDTWTPDRSRKATILGFMDGDLDAARAEWQQFTRRGFVEYLVQSGRLGRGDMGVDDGC
jgi:hypothetical protein